VNAVPDPLDPEDAIELVEMLTFISDWFDGHDAELLAASFRRFMGTSGYEFDELHADIDRFAFLLGDDGNRLFRPDQQPPGP
jgi:hypothetical protein